MFMAEKVLYLDLETTGTDANNNAIIQIAGIIEINGEVKDEFDFHIKPFVGAEVKLDAIAINGQTLESLATYPDGIIVKKQVTDLFGKYIDSYKKNKGINDKFQFVGWNGDFDFQFLSKFWERNNDKYLGSYIHYYHRLDTQKILNALWAMGKIEIENTKLETIAAYFGISLTNAHDALGDVRATREITLQVCQKLNWLKDV